MDYRQKMKKQRDALLKQYAYERSKAESNWFKRLCRMIAVP